MVHEWQSGEGPHSLKRFMLIGTRGGSGDCDISEPDLGMQRMGTMLEEALPEPERASFICFWFLASPGTATGMFILFSPFSVGPSWRSPAGGCSMKASWSGSPSGG